MFERVLIAYDGSTAAAAGLSLAAELARTCGSKVTVVHVVERDGRSDQAAVDPPPAGLEAARRWLGELCERNSTSGHPPLVPVTIENVDPAATMLDLAEQKRADLVVVGRSGRHSLGRFLFGSAAERIIRYAPCSVAVFPAESAAATPPRVLAGYDGSEPSTEALRVAGSLAGALSAGLLVVHVVDSRIPFARTPPESARELIREHGVALLKEGCSKVSAPLESVESELREGDARAELLEAVREYRPRMLVLGHRGSGGFAGLTLGGTASEAVRAAECPVLVVKSLA